MHVISRKKLLEAATRHADSGRSRSTSGIAWPRRAEWKSLADVRETFPSADAVGKYTVFNIKGNSYRLIVEINYRSRRVFVRHVLTHADYDKGGWKR